MLNSKKCCKTASAVLLSKFRCERSRNSFALCGYKFCFQFERGILLALQRHEEKACGDAQNRRIKRPFDEEGEQKMVNEGMMEERSRTGREWMMDDG